MKKLGNTEPRDIVITYVPHGIDSDVFKPVDVPDKFIKEVTGGKEYKFILFWMNRNIKRKQPSDVIWAFSKFVDKLPKKDKDKVCLIMHTNPVDKNGTDLYRVKDAIAPNCDIKFSTEKISKEQLNWFYNISDCTINIAGNEGFGLTTAESLMAGTPIISLVTGGLQDQMGFKYKGKYINKSDYKKYGTLHNYKNWKDKISHGEWVYPIWAKVQTMVGSIPTPYIVDDKCDVDDVADGIKYWYNMSKESRQKCGLSGRKWMLRKSGLNKETMCKAFSESIEKTLSSFKGRDKYGIYKIR